MKNATKTITAKSSFVNTSPRKLRLVADAVRGLQLQKAIDQLQAMPKIAGRELLEVFRQAVGNAKTNFNLSPESLHVASVQVQEGPRFKRRDAHSHGARFDSGIRRRRMSHILVELKANNGTKS